MVRSAQVIVFRANRIHDALSASNWFRCLHPDSECTLHQIDFSILGQTRRNIFSGIAAFQSKSL